MIQRKNNLKFIAEPTFRKMRAFHFLGDIKSIKRNAKGKAALKGKVLRFYKKFLAFEEADRFFIVNNLSEIENDLACLFLEKVLVLDSNQVVRHEAAFSLGCIGDTGSVSTLKHAILNDKSILVRHESIMTLADIGSTTDIDFLNQLKDDNDEVVSSLDISKKRLHDRLQCLLPPKMIEAR